MTSVFGKDVLYDSPLHLRLQQMGFVSKSLLTSRMLHSYVPKLEEEVNSYLDKHWLNDEGEVDLCVDLLTNLLLLSLAPPHVPYARAQVRHFPGSHHLDCLALSARRRCPRLNV